MAVIGQVGLAWLGAMAKFVRSTSKASKRRRGRPERYEDDDGQEDAVTQAIYVQQNIIFRKSVGKQGAAEQRKRMPSDGLEGKRKHIYPKE